MHENCLLSDFYEFMKKNPFFVPSIYIYEKLIRFYSKSVPSKVMKENSINVPSIYFQIVEIKRGKNIFWQSISTYL